MTDKTPEDDELDESEAVAHNEPEPDVPIPDGADEVPDDGDD
ncbi:MAG: hypothetical protein AAGC49_09635 [Brevundimonas sp.]